MSKLSILVCLSASLLIGTAEAAGNTISQKILVGGIERTFRYYKPKDMVENPGILFVLHGSNGKGRIMRIVTGREFEKAADQNKNLIIVYPDGHKKYWNDCRKTAGWASKSENVDEIAFFKQMIHYFGSNEHADTTRAFVTGISNGGQMCTKLALEMPQYFRGIAPISANMPVDASSDCFQSGIPVSMLIMHGTADPLNPYIGGKTGLNDGYDRGEAMTTMQTVAYWLNLDKCDPAKADSTQYPDINTSDNSVAWNYTWSSASTGKKVVFIKIINGGHNIPNPGFALWPKMLGNVNKDIDGPQIIVDFFESL